MSEAIDIEVNADVDEAAKKLQELAQAAVKPGKKSTEFWITVAAHMVGLALAAWGAHKGNDTITAIGGILLAISQGTYTMGRSAVKKAAAAVLLCAVFVGCGTPGYIKASAIEGTLVRLIDRHDVYVEADASLSEPQRRANLRDGTLLKKLLSEAQAPVGEEE